MPKLRLSIRQAMSMPMFDPGQRLAEEQDYVQAYENVREKYKGNNAPHFFLFFSGFHSADDDHAESMFEWGVQCACCSDRQ